MSPPSTTRGESSRRDLVKGSALLGAWIAVGRIAYAIEGEVVFTTPLGSVRRPYRHEGRLELYR